MLKDIRMYLNNWRLKVILQGTIHTVTLKDGSLPTPNITMTSNWQESGSIPGFSDPLTEKSNAHS